MSTSNVKRTAVSEHFWKLSCSNTKCRRLRRKGHFKVKMAKPCHVQTPLGRDVEECMPLWCEGHSQVELVKSCWSWTTFGSWGSSCVCAHRYFENGHELLNFVCLRRSAFILNSSVPRPKAGTRPCPHCSFSIRIDMLAEQVTCQPTCAQRVNTYVASCT